MNDLRTLRSLLGALWRHLAPRRRHQYVLLTALTVVSAGAEVMTVGAAVPFIAVLATPELAFKFHTVRVVAQLFGVHDGNGLRLPLTIAFSVTAVGAAAIRLLLIWACTRFTFATGTELSQEVYRRTLYQPYHVHISRSSSEIISGISAKIGGTMLSVLLPSLMLASSITLLVAIMSILVVIAPLAATISAVGFGGSYCLVTWVTKRRLSRNSVLIAAQYTSVVKALQEGLGGIRDVLLDGTQPFYCETYRQADMPLRRAQGNNIFIQQSPRPIIESFGMMLIAGLAYGLSLRGGGLASALPALVALALGAQRLLPALQEAYASWSSIAGSHAILADTVDLLDQPLPPGASQAPPAPLRPARSIELSNLRFRYAADAPWVIDGLDLKIPRGALVGFVGATGGGKSTTMDLFMGLLSPTAGEIFVDGTPLTTASVRAWQLAIAHVPQHIYLADASFAENIAFGVPRDSIDMDRVRRAAQRAQIAEFVESRPGAYGDFVGERGVRLSGGQRQRIGIARALYKQASVLVLDEATSALDNITERSVLEAIEALGRDMTVLIIAHRLSTVQRCDIVVELERGRVVAQGKRGRVVAQGNYEQLLERSQTFRQMARATSSS